jgi:epsilon-lactone hydrolase
MKAILRVLTIMALICAAGLSAGTSGQGASAGDAPYSRPEMPNEDGSIHIEAGEIPFSEVASPQARRSFVAMLIRNRQLASCGGSSVDRMRKCLDDLAAPRIAILQRRFDTNVHEETIGGIRTYIVEPSEGVPDRNRNRVLINLHGGNMEVGALFSGGGEAIPIAGVGGFKVVAVDYSLAPEHRYPAANKDIVAVYKELLKRYRSENIGIYGCSAGGMLTGETVAWLDKLGLPKPGAIGIFSSAAGLPLGKVTGFDSLYIASPLMALPIPKLDGASLKAQSPYYADADLSDPLVSPLVDKSLTSRFPPTLHMTGTRDVVMSLTVTSHEALSEAGVRSELHVIEGGAHCFFADQAGSDPDVPENMRAWRTIVKFFDRELGQSPH